MTQDTYGDKDGELSRKHGNTLIGTLRSHYGSDFAAGCSESDRLTDVLDQLDEASLTNLARDYEAGKLTQIFSQLKLDAADTQCRFSLALSRAIY